MKVVKIINRELGWDNVMCLAGSLEAAAFHLEYDTVKDLMEYVSNDKDISLVWEEVQTLPEETLEKSIEKHWR